MKLLTRIVNLLIPQEPDIFNRFKPLRIYCHLTGFLPATIKSFEGGKFTWSPFFIIWTLALIVTSYFKLASQVPGQVPIVSGVIQLSVGLGLCSYIFLIINTPKFVSILLQLNKSDAIFKPPAQRSPLWLIVWILFVAQFLAISRPWSRGFNFTLFFIYNGANFPVAIFVFLISELKARIRALRECFECSIFPEIAELEELRKAYRILHRSGDELSESIGFPCVCIGLVLSLWILVLIVCLQNQVPNTRHIAISSIFFSLVKILIGSMCTNSLFTEWKNLSGTLLEHRVHDNEDFNEIQIEYFLRFVKLHPVRVSCLSVLDLGMPFLGALSNILITYAIAVVQFKEELSPLV